MAQNAILIYANDSAHAPDATKADIESCDEHADELESAGAMLAAYALAPRAMATSIRAGSVTHGPFIGVEVRPVHSGGAVERDADN